jgi:hypothetical protein
MNLDRRKTREKASAQKDMVQHLRPTVVDNAEPAVRGDCPIRHHQGPVSKMSVSGIVFGSYHDPEWGFMVLGIEIPANRNERMAVRIKQVVNRKAEFQRLGASL